jgi:hypothetical protein
MVITQRRATLESRSQAAERCRTCERGLHDYLELETDHVATAPCSANCVDQVRRTDIDIPGPLLS